MQPLAPPSLERVVRRCLAKSPDERWDGAHDVADELRWIAQGGPTPAAEATSRRRRLGLLVAGGLAVAVVSGIVGAQVGGRWTTGGRQRPMVVRSFLDVSPAEELNAGGVYSKRLPTPGGSRTALAWTPDGRSLVFVGRRGGVHQLYVRDLDGDEARLLEGTEGAQVPVVSPDGRSVAFWAEAEREPAAVTTKLEGDVLHVLPHLLPDGHAILYTVRSRVWTWGDEEVVAHVFATGERKALLRDAADARYVPSGHLVFLRRGVLHAVGFDPARLEVRGAPEAVLGGIAQALTGGTSYDVTGAGQFGVAPTGALAFLRGAVVPYPDRQLVVIDRQGRVNPLEAPARSYAPTLSLSPDGRRLAVAVRGLTDQAAWVLDRERGTLTRLPGGGEKASPRWTPAGDRIAFSHLDRGINHLAWERADGTGVPEILARDLGYPSSWSPDGRQLALAKDGDIWIATLDGGKAALAPLATTPEAEAWPEFSPDGRWVAFASNATGRFEVYVQPYPGPGPRQLVSLEGGSSPAWNPNGRELFFLSPPDAEGKQQMMVADVRPSPTLGIGRPRPLFAFSPSEASMACGPARCYAVAPDGQRFYAVQMAPTPPTPPVTHIQLVLNWTEELKARAAARTTR